MTAEESGWVVEHAESDTARPLYWRGDNPESRPEGDENPFNHWSYDHMQAVRFARKVDAERVKFLSEVRICEHGWG